jgi:hypothetical protein
MANFIHRIAWSLHTAGLRFGRADQRWGRPSAFDDRWKRRIRKMASYIDTPGTVVDFGCGPMWLREMLPLGNPYIPLDIEKRCPDCLVVDLNRDDIPDTGAEFAFLSGVLEYIADLPGFFHRLTSQDYRRIILSYCTTDRHPYRWLRRHLNWVSHASTHQLLRALLQGYVLVAIDEVDSNPIFVVEKSR